MVRLGLSQIDLIIQILLFPLRVPRFLRDTLLPLADCADAAERRRKGQYNKRRRCLTMLNRWWNDSATCGERIPHYHSASKMSNNVVPLRGTLLLVPPLRRLRPCGLASGYAWFAISDGPSMQSLGLWQYALWNNRCRHTTARAVATSITSR